MSGGADFGAGGVSSCDLIFLSRDFVELPDSRKHGGRTRTEMGPLSCWYSRENRLMSFHKCDEFILHYREACSRIFLPINKLRYRSQAAVEVFICGTSAWPCQFTEVKCALTAEWIQLTLPVLLLGATLWLKKTKVCQPSTVIDHSDSMEGVAYIC